MTWLAVPIGATAAAIAMLVLQYRHIRKRLERHFDEIDKVRASH